MSRSRILVISNLYPPDVQGGYELGCRQMAEALRARGHEVRVLTSAPRTPVPTEPGIHRRLQLTDHWSPYLTSKNVPVTSWLTQAEGLHVNAFNVHALLTEIEEFQPDVVYAWMLVGVGGLGLMAALEYVQMPWAWHLMDEIPLLNCLSCDHHEPALIREVQRRLVGTYVACSRQLLERMEAKGLVLGDRVETVPNWVVSPPGPPRTSYLEGGQLRIMGAAGMIEPTADKGIDLLIQAAARLRELGCDDFSVDLYGRDSIGWAARLVQEHDVAGKVHLKGPRPQRELARLYRDYDLFAFPTQEREPFGSVALEAAAMGCVPVMSRTCGVAEWLAHGVHVLKAPRNADAFATVFRNVLRGEVDLEGLGRRASATVRRDFHIEAIAPRVERILSDVARQPRKAAGSAAEAYQLAVLAERLERVLIQERRCA